MPSSSSTDPDHGVASATYLDASAAVLLSRPRTGRGCPEDFASLLRAQDEVDALCEKYGVPKEFTALPAGDLRANSAPPLGAICVHGRALEAGMGVPLHGFFCEALSHFGIAPAQLTPNGWRIMAGFLALCRSNGVPPSLPAFRYFFQLPAVSQRQRKGWYCFRSRNSSGLRFTGMPSPNSSDFKDWKREFFFLSSPEPWPCPVKWGEPSKISLKIPVLTREESKWAAKLVLPHGGGPVDLRTYLCNSNLAAAMITTATLPPSPAPSFAGMDPFVYGMMNTMLAEKEAAAQATAKKVKAEPGTKEAALPPLRGKKRSLEEANDRKCPPPSMRNTALPSGVGVCSAPPGFSLKTQRFPRRQLKEAKSELGSAKRDAEQEKAKAELAATGAGLAKATDGLAAAEAEVVKAQAELTAAKRAADATREKGRPELTMEGVELEEAKAKLAVAKRILEEELESAKSAALHQLLCCEERVRRRAQHALEGYRQWRTGHAPAGCTAWLAC